jgi:hypothetical protein
VFPRPFDGVSRRDTGQDHYARDDAAGAAVAGVTRDLDKLAGLHPIERLDDEPSRLIRVGWQSKSVHSMNAAGCQGVRCSTAILAIATALAAVGVGGLIVDERRAGRAEGDD